MQLPGPDPSPSSSQVVNATFPSFLKLCKGEYGGVVKEPGHTLLAVNCSWTEARDIGQLWERKLKAEAAMVLKEVLPPLRI